MATQTSRGSGVLATTDLRAAVTGNYERRLAAIEPSLYPELGGVRIVIILVIFSNQNVATVSVMTRHVKI